MKKYDAYLEKERMLYVVAIVKGDKAEAKKYAQHLEDSYPSSPYYNDISKEILYN